MIKGILFGYLCMSLADSIIFFISIYYNKQMSSRRGSVASINENQNFFNLPVARERSNSISSVLNNRRGSVASITSTKEEIKKEVVVEEKKECKKNGLKSIQAMVDALTSKLTLLEKQNHQQISNQTKEISQLKETVKDILEG